MSAPASSANFSLMNGASYASAFKSIANDYPSRHKLHRAVMDQENKCREFFAQQRDAALLNDDHLMMIDVHNHADIFQRIEESSEEKRIPKIFPQVQQIPLGLSTIVNKQEFKRNFDVFTEGQLREMDWTGVFCAGGCVLACLQPILEKEYDRNNRTRRAFYHTKAYTSSDIDLFLYGMTEDQANEKLKQIYSSIREVLPEELICFRSKHAISLVSKFPYRHIQIILRLYKSPSEILQGFDVDACAVGFDGNKVWMMPRCHHALVTQTNMVDMSRRSPSYEQRLAKYSFRGFSVCAPSLQRSRIDPQLFDQRFDKLQGLSRLLLLEKLSSPEERHIFKERQRIISLRPQYKKQSRFWSKLTQMIGDEAELERYESIEGAGADASDYSTVFLPWGPKWNARRIQKIMFYKDIVLNSKWYDPLAEKRHQHPCFFGTMKQVMNDCCGCCPQKPEDMPEDSPFVMGPIKWITVDPGRQSIGSFHPITEGDWTEGAYINPLTEKMCTAVNSNDPATVEQLIKDGVAIDKKDALGRTPLHLAALVNSVDCCKVLLNAGAWISARLPDGRTPLHIAAQYGHEEIIKLIIARGLEIQKQQNEEKSKEDTSGGAKPSISKDTMDVDNDEGEKVKGDEEGDEDEGEHEDGEDEDGEDEDREDEDEEERPARRNHGSKKKKTEEEEEEGEKKVDEFNVDAEDWDMRMTPLMYAVFLGWKECARLLIDEGKSNINKHLEFKEEERVTLSYDLLQLVCRSLSDRPSDSDTTPDLASIRNACEVAKLIIDRGFDLNNPNTNGETALHFAIETGQLELVKLYVENKANVNFITNRKESPLLLAVRKKSKEIVSFLLSQGAHAEILRSDIESRARTMKPRERYVMNDVLNRAKDQPMLITQPIHVAAENESKEIMELLLKHASRSSLEQSFRSHGWRRYQTAIDVIFDAIEHIEQMITHYKKQKRTKNKKGLSAFKTFMSNFIEKPSSTQLSASRAQKFRVSSGRWPESDEDVKDLEKSLEKKKELLHWMESSRFVRFIKLKLHDKDLQETQKTMRQEDLRKKSSRDDGTVADDDDDEETKKQKNRVFFSSVGQKYYRYPEELLDKYRRFFEAVWHNDIDTVNALTAKAPQTTAKKAKKAKKAHHASDEDSDDENASANEDLSDLPVQVASQYENTGITPLHLALGLGHSEMAVRLLQIAAEQYEPLKRKKKEPAKGPPTISNFDLAAVHTSIKPRHFLDDNDSASEDSGDDEDQTFQPAKTCRTSPLSLILTNTREWPEMVSCLHLATHRGHAHTLQQFLRAVKQCTKIGRVPKDEDASLKLSPVVYLLRQECSFHGESFTPLELALASGQTTCAFVLLEEGGADQLCLSSKDKADQPTGPDSEAATTAVVESKKSMAYKGLDVFGKKKEKWAGKHSNRLYNQMNKAVDTRSGLHIAAMANQVSSIALLLGNDPIIPDPTPPVPFVPPSGAPGSSSSTPQGPPTKRQRKDSSSQDKSDTSKVTWYWQNRADWKPYSATDQNSIEKGYQQWHQSGGKKECEVVDINAEYCVDFKKSIQMRKDDNTRTRKIKRNPPIEEPKSQPKKQDTTASSSSSSSSSSAVAVLDKSQLRRSFDYQKLFRLSAVDPDGNTALHYAVRNFRVQALTELLKYDAANVGDAKIIDKQNHSGLSPLAMAAHYGRPEIMKMLLDAGADPLLVDKPKIPMKRSIVVMDEQGWTPLHHAAFSGQGVDLILAAIKQHGASWHHNSCTFTPIMIAARGGKLHALTLLLSDLASDLGERDVLGQSVLHHGARSGFKQCLSALLNDREVAAFLHAESSFGLTPIDMALRLKLAPIRDNSSPIQIHKHKKSKKSVSSQAKSIQEQPSGHAACLMVLWQALKSKNGPIKRKLADSDTVRKLITSLADESRQIVAENKKHYQAVAASKYDTLSKVVYNSSEGENESSSEDEDETENVNLDVFAHSHFNQGVPMWFSREDEPDNKHGGDPEPGTKNHNSESEDSSSDEE